MTKLETTPEYPPKNSEQSAGYHATEHWLERMDNAQQQLRNAMPWMTTGVAAAHAGAHLASEVFRLVQGVHGTVAAAPLPFAPTAEAKPRGLSKLVYKCVETGFIGTEQALSTLAAALPANTHQHAHWLNIQSAVNGVIGDRLVATNNRLAIPMQRVPAEAQNDHPHLVLFVHGLCMNEQGWAGNAHQAFKSALDGHRMRVEYLRYNTGRHISENGASLAALLAEIVRTENPQSISLVGHSMGGLVIRSAMAQASKRDQSDEWVDRLKRCIYLGTPHHGAPLERLGNHANRLLKVSPYTAPFMRLGNIRSAGIQDLRHGCIVQEDWANRMNSDDVSDYRSPQALPKHIGHLFVAATRSDSIPDALHHALDDYLVPVTSALGLCPHNRLTLNAPTLFRQTLPQSHHMDLLSSSETHRLLHEHLRR